MALNSKDLVQVNNVIINTGNILSLNDITKKTIQNPSEELLEAINITIKEYQNGQTPSQPDQPLIVSRPNDDSVSKISEHDSSDLKFGFKIFLTSDDPVLLIDSIEKALITLNVASVNNVIIAFIDKRNDIGEIKSVWTALEDYVLQNKINKIGIADVEEEIFRSLFEWSNVKPSIIQINLSTCCVVPPSLQSFCKEHDIQLLTHSDPTDILPKTSLDVVLGKEYLLKWVVRFLVHIKCRGVLTTKGYLLSLGK
ncbi:glutamate--cysteine ligase regulatory subunit [Harmonia axyridis]|uniref:glutamate--cysteine ligase regulatory subunit n=1 Tax=Harmonia axyridis TaxID=115357 RepID=UPI001E2790F7|nr:glutamate--cysteine ligase regulatory subunit [Harmonia axyridis]